MSTTYKYPDFDVIDAHIRRARAERAVVLAGLIAAGIDATLRVSRAFARRVAANVALKDRAMQGNPFVKGVVPHH